jgi:hypothetical protein
MISPESKPKLTVSRQGKEKLTRYLNELRCYQEYMEEEKRDWEAEYRAKGQTPPTYEWQEALDAWGEEEHLRQESLKLADIVYLSLCTLPCPWKVFHYDDLPPLLERFVIESETRDAQEVAEAVERGLTEQLAPIRLSVQVLTDFVRQEMEIYKEANGPALDGPERRYRISGNAGVEEVRLGSEYVKVSGWCTPNARSQFAASIAAVVGSAFSLAGGDYHVRDGPPSVLRFDSAAPSTNPHTAK